MEKKREERVGEWLGMGAGAGVGDASRAAAGEGVGWRRRRRWRVWRARREEERAAAMEAGDRIEIGFAVAGSGVRSQTRDRVGGSLDQAETRGEFSSIFLVALRSVLRCF